MRPGYWNISVYHTDTWVRLYTRPTLIPDDIAFNNGTDIVLLTTNTNLTVINGLSGAVIKTLAISASTDMKSHKHKPWVALKSRDKDCINSHYSIIDVSEAIELYRVPITGFMPDTQAAFLNDDFYMHTPAGDAYLYDASGRNIIYYYEPSVLIINGTLFNADTQDISVSKIRQRIGGKMYSADLVMCFYSTMAVGNNILAVVNNTNGVGPKSITLYSLDPKDYVDT